MRMIITTLFIVAVAFGQTRTVVVGTETKKDMPAREYKAGAKLYLDARKSRSSSQRASLYGQAFTKFKSALDWLQQFRTKPELDPNGKYKGDKGQRYQAIFMLQAAKSAANSGNFTEADRYFNQLTGQVDKTNFRAWYEYGDYLFDRSKRTAAKNAFEKAITLAEPALKSDNRKTFERAKDYLVRAHYKMGDVHSGRSNSDAITHYKKAIEIDNDYWRAHLKIGKVYEEMKNWTGMYEANDNVVRIMTATRGGRAMVSRSVKRRQLAKALLLKGIAATELKRFSDAISTLKQVPSTRGATKIGIDASYYYLGLAYKGSGQRSAAIATLSKVQGAFKKSAQYELDILKNPDKYTN